MTFPGLSEIQEAVRTERIKRLPESTLEQYLESLAVSSANADDATLTRLKGAVRVELQRRADRGRPLWNIVAGVIGVLGALVALVVLKSCH